MNNNIIDLFIHHYSSQIGIHVVDLVSNTKILGNPAKIFSSLHEVWINNFKEDKLQGGSNYSKKVFKESFITLYQAHSKATGNFEHNVYQNYLMQEGQSGYFFCDPGEKGTLDERETRK